MQEQPERKTLNISRYSSRRLYNTGVGEYVTVDDLATYIREGYDIKVTDKKSGEDITGQILLQIIAEQQEETGNVLPVNILTDLVRHHASGTKSLVPEFLSESFAMLKGHRKKLSQSLIEQVTNPLDPTKAMNSLEAWREAQSDIMNSLASAWLPKPKSEPDEVRIPNEKKADRSDEIDLLKRQVAEMQAKLESIQTD